MKAPVKMKRKYGEDFLVDVEQIKVTLESGREETFAFLEEVGGYHPDYPEKPGDLADMTHRAIARYGFWAYQCERALARVRELEGAVDGVRAVHHEPIRQHFRDHGDAYISKERVQAAVSVAEQVVDVEERLNSARKQYGLLRTVRDATEHRCYLLRALLRKACDTFPEHRKGGGGG